MREIKKVFRRYRSQPIERVINLSNPVLRKQAVVDAINAYGPSMADARRPRDANLIDKYGTGKEDFNRCRSEE